MANPVLTALCLRRKKLLRTNILIVFLLISFTAESERSDIGIIVTLYGFDGIRELCKFKHHGSSVNVNNQFQVWKKKNAELFKSAYSGLEQEAAKDKVKMEKLQTLDLSLKNTWGKRFIEMDDELTAYLCFFDNGATSYFNKLLEKQID